MKKTQCSCHSSGLSRRELLRALGLLGIALPVARGMMPLFPGLSSSALASGAATPKRFLQIFLNGAWDSLLSTDPVLSGSAKALSGNFESAYYTTAHSSYPGAPIAISGKTNIKVGPGLAPAAIAMAGVPMAVVNGMYVEVTAHELAVNYLYSGLSSLSRSREYPAIIATMADRTGGFPAHVILGGAIPLSTTKDTNPPLQSVDTETFRKMLAGPYTPDGESGLSDGSYDAAHSLIAALNTEYNKRLGHAAKTGLSAWNVSEKGLQSLYAKHFAQKLDLAPLRTDFEAAEGDNDSIGTRLATAFLVLKEGISHYCTVNMDGFDTHQNHFATHLPLMQSFARSFSALLTHLAAANDPDIPSKKLIETTTILVSSEFTRTPKLNSPETRGTDHWQSASAMLFGQFVHDDVVFGATDTHANAMNNAAVGGGKFLPDHLAASVLRALGFAADAEKISGVNLDALFS